MKWKFSQFQILAITKMKSSLGKKKHQMQRTLILNLKSENWKR